MSLAVAQSLVASALVSAMVILVLTRRPPDNLASHLLRAVLAAALFVFSDLGFNLSTSDFWTRVWVSGIYTGVLALAVSWLELAVRYANTNANLAWLPGTRSTFAVRACAASIWLLMITNPLHGQFVELRPDVRNLYHWGFWLHAGFGYLSSAATIVIFAAVWRGFSPGRARRRVGVLVAAPLVLPATSLIQVTFSGSLPFDPTVGAVGLSAFIFIVGVYWTQLFDLTPMVLREVVRLSRDCVLVADGDFALQYANGAAEELLGGSESQLDDDLVAVLAMKLEAEPEDLRRMILGEETESRQSVFREVGRDCYWSLRSEAVASRTGSQIWRTVTLRNVTLQVQAEQELLESHAQLGRRVRERTAELGQLVENKERILEALTESEARYKNLLTASPLGVIACDQNGRIIAVNARFWQLLRRPEPAPNIGIDALDQHVLGSAQISSALGKCIRAGEHPTFDTELRVRDGKTIVLRVHLAPLRDQDQKPRGVQAILEDVTERLRTRRDLVQARDRLEELLQIQSLALQESQNHLRESERLSSIGTLAAGVAHQINNPIGSILLGAEYALNCEDEPDVLETWKRTLMDNVEQAARCGKIVRSLLLFSRGEPTPMWVENINDIVHRACHTTEAFAAGRDSRIREQLDDFPLPAKLSPIQIEQVLVNVLHNAIQSRPSGVSVDVYTQRTGSSILISISDDGPGIEASAVEQIFDPFYTTRSHEGGTGLGLSVAHGIVERHGGKMTVISDVGAGTTVCIELPLIEEDRLV